MQKSVKNEKSQSSTVINKRSDEVKNSLLCLSRGATTFFGDRVFVFSSVEVVG